MTQTQSIAALVGRVLLSLTFLLAGFGKFADPAGMSGYMEAFGTPSILLYPSAILEVVGALALIAGFKTRWAALALAGFTVIATAIFHNQLGDQGQMLFFLKNLAIIGGLLFVYAFGPGAYSVDKR
ncbi:DoxX family protein [Arsenicitalea aurantiaca]|uniref:DoxX family protein n=1 Tax=Arsenicitalea aurantiaca TaxID=1783274 RepID=A0A433XB05_9HYPH|nr:DoxX family protein [Arsenicitalea aurantiaca]RUT31210.1 DoxX family protein [Arsenicitalea aurantiaca]